ncbi:MAG: cystathionine beta-lyase [Rhodospirillales bacterium]
MTDTPSKSDATRLAHLGRDPSRQFGYVNPPVVRGSTWLAPGLAGYEANVAKQTEEYSYARIRNPTSSAFEQAVADLEGGHRAVVAPSGLSAITTAVLAFVKAGGHALVTDSVYYPTRRFFDGLAARFGVSVTYYDPAIGAGIAALMRPETTIVYVESPGSITFEMQDIPVIAAVAHARGAVVIHDGTWGTPLYFRSFEPGVDVSVHAATKYLVGHSDAMLGVVVCNAATFDRVKASAVGLGVCASPDDVFLGLRGLRTLGVRLERHWASGVELARWLETRPEVARVLHPALPSHPGHAIWTRDFRGACGLFGLVLRPVPSKAVEAMVDGLSLFGIGASWGGFESLILRSHPRAIRTAVPWAEEGTLLRIHVGLEDVDDLKADLAAGFERLRTAAG